MDEQLKEMYQQVILDHNKNPRNFKKPEPYTHFAEGYNPLCGDQIDVYLTVENGVVIDVGFQGSGCAISKSSASVMTTLIKGKTLEEAEELFRHFHDLIMGKEITETDRDALGKLTVFEGVKDFPSRVKCASLSWHTMHNAIIGKHENASTE